MHMLDLHRIEDFLKALPLLVAHVDDAAESTADWQAKRLEALFSGIPLNEREQEHSALSWEFQNRVQHLFPKRIFIVINRTQDDLSSPKKIQDTLTKKYRTHAPPGDSSRLNGKRAKSMFEGIRYPSCDMISRTDGMKQTCMVIYPRNINSDPVIDFASWFNASASHLKSFIPVSGNEFDRMNLHHETFGHGTEPLESWSPLPASKARDCEFRADIAAMAGILHDTGNRNAAKAWMFFRELYALRADFQNTSLNDDILLYAYSSQLRKAFTELEKTPNIQSMDDVALVALINRVHAPLSITLQENRRHKTALSHARTIIRDATQGHDTTFHKLSRKNPEQLMDAVEILKNAMEAHAFFINPAPHMQKTHKPGPHLVPKSPI